MRDGARSARDRDGGVRTHGREGIETAALAARGRADGVVTAPI